MSEWKKFTGSDEQIAEISNSENGYSCKYIDGIESRIFTGSLRENAIYDKNMTHFLICNPHPLADMIIRQAMTGQPVWVRDYKDTLLSGEHNYDEYVTTTPNWNIPNAEYSFTPFEE